MVSQITEGTAFDRQGRPFRRRRFLPALCLFAVLALATTAVWAVALTESVEVAQATPCNPPPPPEPGAAPFAGEQVTPTTMVDVVPAKLTDARVRVLNAGGRGGHAADVAESLRDIGFAPLEAANDPVYLASRLNCPGQLRFGSAGQAAAASVWLVAPCVELVSDGRPDDTVDLVIGSEFDALTTSNDVDAVLAGLTPTAATPPDAESLRRAHSTPC